MVTVIEVGSTTNRWMGMSGGKWAANYISFPFLLMLSLITQGYILVGLVQSSLLFHKRRVSWRERSDLRLVEIIDKHSLAEWFLSGN